MGNTIFPKMDKHDTYVERPLIWAFMYLILFIVSYRVLIMPSQPWTRSPVIPATQERSVMFTSMDFNPTMDLDKRPMVVWGLVMLTFVRLLS
jgi:hypothetical protein